MIVHRHGQRLFGMLLADALPVQLAFDLGGLGDIEFGPVLFRERGQFLVEHALAQDHAIVTDINARAGDQLFDFRVRFSAEAAQRDIRRPGHGIYSFLSAKLVAPAKPGICLRDCTTSSTRP